MVLHKDNTILIIEDDPLVSGCICDVLQEFGFIICGSASCEPEAVALAERFRPLLAVTDINLTGARDGIDIARALREQFGVRTVFLSGSWSVEMLDRARGALPLGILAKPFRPSQMLGVILQALGPAHSSNSSDAARDNFLPA